MDYAWLSARDALAIHEEQLAEHGGADGVRDLGLLESALARPQNLLAYAKPDFADLAGAYAAGVARNHPFVDGNKRVGYVMLETFLELNGATFPVSDTDAVIATLKLAAGDSPYEEFIAWVRSNARVPS